MKKVLKDKSVTIPTLIFVLFCLILGASSCKHMVPYSDSIKNERGWDSEKLKHIQFYLSGDILLERVLTKELSEEIRGKVVIKNGKRTEQILLPKGLECAYIGETPSGNYIIKCDIGDGNTLNFGVNPTNNKYQLLATEWHESEDYGDVHYNNKEYTVALEQGNTHLLIDLRRKLKEDNSFKVAGGVKVR